MVSPLILLAHFAKEIGVLKVTNAVTLIGELPGYWYRNHLIPQFIMIMEEAQKKAKRSGLKIIDNWLVAFATSSLLLSNSFPNDSPEWDEIQIQTKRGRHGRTPSTPSTKILSARHAWRGGRIPLAQQLPPNSYTASTPKNSFPRFTAKLPVSPRE